MSDTLPPETIAWSFIDHHQAPSHWHGALMDLIIRARKDGSAAAPSASRPDVHAALRWAMDEIDVLANKLCGWAYPQAMTMGVDRKSEQDNYVKAVEARRCAASTVEPVAKLDPVTDWVGARLRSAAEKALAAAAPTTSPEPSRTTATSAEPVAYVPVSKASDELLWRETFAAKWLHKQTWQGFELKPLYATPPSSGNADAVRAALEHLLEKCNCIRPLRQDVSFETVMDTKAAIAWMSAVERAQKALKGEAK